MIQLLSYIIWSPDPEIFVIPLSGIGLSDRPIVWYGMLFALGFIISQQVLYRIFRADGEPEKDVDTLTTYMVIATIVGARLGHCLFYDPVHYLSNPIEILKVWEGGLASHGGAIAILIAIWIYAQYDIRVKWNLFIPINFSAKRIKREKQSYLWVLDRLAIVTMLTGALIRTGNFMNSEMEGLETDSSFGVVYARGAKEVMIFDEDMVEDVTFEKLPFEAPSSRVPIQANIQLSRGVEFDTQLQQFIESRMARQLFNYREVVEHIDFSEGRNRLDYDVSDEGRFTTIQVRGTGTVRHAAQLYEAIACLVMMLILFWIWKNKRDEVPVGFNFALFMMMLWTERFFNEFFKMDQEAFEASLPINMGQILSIPMFLFGLAVMVYVYKKEKNQ